MKRLIMAIAGWLAISCSEKTESVTYADDIADGADALSSLQYAEAITFFNAAIEKNPDRPEAYAGLGWAYLRMDNIDSSASAFALGITKESPGADMYAGYAFLLNTDKEYAASNTRVATALSLSAQWTLTYGLGLDYKDLYLLKAENHFALGEYTQSLNAVKVIESSFSANVATAEGIAQLANKIESLKAVAKAFDL